MTDSPFVLITDVIGIQARPGMVLVTLGSQIDGKPDPVPAVRLVMPADVAITVTKALLDAADRAAEFGKNRPRIGDRTFDVDAALAYGVAFSAIANGLASLLKRNAASESDIKTLADEIKISVVRDAKNTNFEGPLTGNDETGAVDAAVAAIDKVFRDLLGDIGEGKASGA